MDSGELRRLAGKATPGPWRTFGMELRASTCPERCADYDHSTLLAVFLTERDGHPRTFDLDLTIAAASPDRILALLDELDAAVSARQEAESRLATIEGALREIVSAFDKSGNVPMFLAAVIREARATLARTREPAGGVKEGERG